MIAEDSNELEVAEYDITGNVISGESKLSVAKHTKFFVTNTEKFFVKVCTAGLNGSKFFDPLTNLIEELKRHDLYAGRDRYSYKVVSKECFNHYLNYLKTKNISYLRNAERSM
mgnify:CR=1 FL=1